MLTKNKKHVNRLWRNWRWLNCTFVVMVALAVLIMLGVNGCPTPWPGPPKHVAPADGSVFDHYPRTITIEWAPVEQAVKYKYQVQYWVGINWSAWLIGEVTSTTYTFDFPDGLWRGRWCITPINANGMPGITSGWWEFEFK